MFRYLIIYLLSDLPSLSDDRSGDSTPFAAASGKMAFFKGKIALSAGKFSSYFCHVKNNQGKRGASLYFSNK